jgi:hypothetical protein
MSPRLRLRGAHLTSHPLIEDVVFTVLSFLVLAVAIAAVMSSGRPSLAIAVSAAAQGANPQQIVVYGSLVDGNGEPIKNALIEIQYADGRREGSCRTKNDGTFKTQFNEGPAPYTVVVTVYENGQPITGTCEFNAQPGYCYGIQAVFTPPSTFVFVPLPGY